MASHLSFVVFLALAATAAVSAFDITSMSSKAVQVKEGDDIVLWCKSDSYWEWCDITHVASGATCEHVWNNGLYNVKVGECSDFAGRFEYIGDKGSSVYKCGIRVKDVRPEEAGEWKCDITGYYDGKNKWKQYQKDQGETASKSFQVDVEIKTTTTTTTTPKPTTTDYVYEYPEEPGVDEPSNAGNSTQPGSNKRRKSGAGFNTTYLIIIVVAVVVVCVLIVLCALHFKKKLPAFGGAGKNFKPVDQNETQEGAAGDVPKSADDPEGEEAKHPSIVKANGSSNGVSPTKEAAAAKPADEAEINPELTKVTWTSEKEKAEAEGEDKPLKGVEED